MYEKWKMYKHVTSRKKIGCTKEQKYEKKFKYKEAVKYRKMRE